MAINPNFPDPTQVHVISPVSTNLLAFPEACPAGFEEVAEGPDPAEEKRLKAQGASRVVVCEETIETLTAREAERAKSQPPPAPDFEARGFSSDTPVETPSGRAPLPPFPDLPPGYFTGPSCPPDFEEVPGGAEQYGIKPAQLEGFEPVPIRVCREKTKASK